MTKDTCERTYGGQAKNVAQFLFVLVITSVIIVCIQQSGLQARLEMGTIACSVSAAAAVVAFFSYVTVTTQRTPCLRDDLRCGDDEKIKSPAVQAINWMASFIALGVVLHMYRQQSGVWHLIGAYAAISLLGVSAAMGFSAYVDHALGSTLAQKCSASSV